MCALTPSSYCSPGLTNAAQKEFRASLSPITTVTSTALILTVIDRLREQNPDIEILAGIELDNDPVTSTDGVRWVEKNWDRLDFVLGSVHYFSGETEMLDRAGETGQIESRGVAEAFDQYVRELEKLVSRGHIDCLAHLDLVKIHGLSPDGLRSGRTISPDSRDGAQRQVWQWKRAQPVGERPSANNIRTPRSYKWPSHSRFRSQLPRTRIRTHRWPLITKSLPPYSTRLV